MKNKLLLKLLIVGVSVFIYSLIYYYTQNDKNNRIDELYTKELDNLKTHYNLTTKYYKINSENVVSILNSNDKVIDLLSEFVDASDQKRVELRSQLHEILLPHYKRIQKQGVLQFHFLLPNNVTSLRMHKPSKFDDDLTDFKYSFKYVNETQQPLNGLERGRTSPSFRNVYPLFSKQHKHIGAVDIAFAPEVIQQNLYESSKIYSNFIIKKSIFDLRKWRRNDLKNDYKVSIENDSYLNYAYKQNDIDDKLEEFIVPFKKMIKSKMSKNATFALYYFEQSKAKVVAFLPIANTQNEVIAYLISYSDNPYIESTLFDFYVLNLIVIMVLILISLYLYKNIKHNLELKEEKDKFHHLSQYDPLTQLPNRLLLQDRLNQSIIKANRHKSKFAMFFIDLDNFKNINDAHGHFLGDKVLQVVSKIIKNTLREEDTLARIGGDEFVVIIEELHYSIDCSTSAQKIINALKKAIVIEDESYYIGASIGISIFPDDSTNATDLLKYSDIAMYRAKSMGKNKSQFYSSKMAEEVLNRVNVEKDLRQAIKNKEFEVYYQPQINAKINTLMGMEVLVRWNHPTKGLVAPIHFIPLAEETGLIVPIDRWVMNTAMKQVVAWQKEALHTGVLSMNLSVRQLEHEQCIEELKKMIELHGIDPKMLELEVTEGQIMTNQTQAIEILHQIHDLGIELAIDDFGTGYSSLSYLKKLPIDKLKIDKSFVDDLPEDEDSMSITKAIISLSKNLNLKVIAEGVETSEQKEFLVENGCDNIQGYYYSKPLPAKEMQAYLLEFTKR